MAVGKRDTKTAPNIGIKNYEILPSLREKKVTLDIAFVSFINV